MTLGVAHEAQRNLAGPSWTNQTRVARKLWTRLTVSTKNLVKIRLVINSRRKLGKVSTLVFLKTMMKHSIMMREKILDLSVMKAMTTLN